MLDNIEQYKRQQLDKLRENYAVQVSCLTNDVPHVHVVWDMYLNINLFSGPSYQRELYSTNGLDTKQLLDTSESFTQH